MDPARSNTALIGISLSFSPLNIIKGIDQNSHHYQETLGNHLVCPCLAETPEGSSEHSVVLHAAAAFSFG